jgi:hypothetical protein
LPKGVGREYQLLDVFGSGKLQYGFDAVLAGLFLFVKAAFILNQECFENIIGFK